MILHSARDSLWRVPSFQSINIVLARYLYYFCLTKSAVMFWFFHFFILTNVSFWFLPSLFGWCVVIFTLFCSLIRSGSLHTCNFFLIWVCCWCSILLLLRRSFVVSFFHLPMLRFNVLLSHAVINLAFFLFIWIFGAIKGEKIQNKFDS